MSGDAGAGVSCDALHNKIARTVNARPAVRAVSLQSLKMVGAVRFELTTSCTPSKRAYQATLRPDRFAPGGRPSESDIIRGRPSNSTDFLFGIAPPRFRPLNPARVSRTRLHEFIADSAAQAGGGRPGRGRASLDLPGSRAAVDDAGRGRGCRAGEGSSAAVPGPRRS